MLSAATMQYYYPAGPATAAGYPKPPCRSAMPYYAALNSSAVEPLPSPTPLHNPMSSLYTTRSAAAWLQITSYCLINCAAF